ncbi:MAG: N-acetyltransferase [Alphaproteobacteria bacterium]|nr:MAG: N-acetyltransferase [Alphaproteobacteria bacterium]
MKPVQEHGPIDIRPATVADLDDIVNLEKKSFGDQAWRREILRRYLQSGEDNPTRVPIFVAFAKAANGETGFAGYTIGCRGGKDNGMVLDLVVSPEFKGQHLGRALLEQVSESLKDAGASRLTLEVESTNKPAIRLYESVGFVKDRLLPDCYGEKRDAYWMIKPAAKGPRPGP